MVIDLADESLDEEIPVDITTYSMKKIQEFFDHHEYKELKPIKKPVRTNNFASITSEWDNTFFSNLTEDQISDLVMVSCFQRVKYDNNLGYCLPSM